LKQLILKGSKSSRGGGVGIFQQFHAPALSQIFWSETMIRSRRFCNVAAAAGACNIGNEQQQQNLKQMLAVEASLVNHADHRQLVSARHSPQSLAWRELVSQWYYDVSDHLEESRDVPYVAMNMLDRYLASSSSRPVEKNSFEVVAITSLFLAVKLNGSSSLTIPDLLSMSRSPLDANCILATGKDMLQVLSFDAKIFTPTDFLKAMISLHSSLDDRMAIELFERSAYMCEISVSDHFFVGVQASKIACAALKAVLDLPSTCQKMNTVPVKQLLRSLDLEFGFQFGSHELSLISARLYAIFSESAEDFTGSSTQPPHLIENDDDSDNEEDETPSMVEFCAINTPESNGSVHALVDPPSSESPRHSKRQRFVYE
jgi:hypothetical protein